MNRRSLLDYLADKEEPDMPEARRQTAELLERRLTELQERLAVAEREQAAPANAPATPQADAHFASQIESILRRRHEPVAQVRMESPLPEEPARRHYPRMEMQSPPLAPQLPDEARPADFSKFVEAVHLIGQAAHRFLLTPEPPRQAIAQHPPGSGDDTLQLTNALRETIAAFQCVTSDLVNAAGEMRRAAMPRRSEADSLPQSSRRADRNDDAELFRLQDDLDDLRERLGAMTRRRNPDRY